MFPRASSSLHFSNWVNCELNEQIESGLTEEVRKNVHLWLFFATLTFAQHWRTQYTKKPNTVANSIAFWRFKCTVTQARQRTSVNAHNKDRTAISLSVCGSKTFLASKSFKLVQRSTKKRCSNYFLSSKGWLDKGKKCRKPLWWPTFAANKLLLQSKTHIHCEEHLIGRTQNQHPMSYQIDR